MNRNFFLIFHGRFPSEKAAALFAAKSAEAFATQGLRVTLVVPMRIGALVEDPYVYYDLKNSFDIVYVKVIDAFGNRFLKHAAFFLSYLSFSIRTFFYIRKTSTADGIIYSNEILPLTLISYSRKNCFYEMHDFPESKFFIFGKMLKRMKWILVHNKWKLAEIKKLFPSIHPEKFLYEPNAVDIKAFDIPISKEEVRAKLSLPLAAKIAVYTGHLYSWKGVDTLALSAKHISDFQIVFVGGTREDVKKFKEKYGTIKNISIIGHVKHSEIPMWQKAADVLVLPNTAKEKISAFYTSPMKLFEYMASSRPIVATDIPSIREIADETNAIIVVPDNEEALARGIKSAVDEPEHAKAIAEQAMKDVLSHTWEKRAKRIIAFIR